MDNSGFIYFKDVKVNVRKTNMYGNNIGKSVV